jgi:hypothetical protein
MGKIHKAVRESYRYQHAICGERRPYGLIYLMDEHVTCKKCLRAMEKKLASKD